MTDINGAKMFRRFCAFFISITILASISLVAAADEKPYDVSGETATISGEHTKARFLLSGT